MGSLLGAGRAAPYQRRVDILLSNGVALWDVLARAERAGSLDKGVARGSEVANDFGLFLARHPAIARIYFNGERPSRYYRKLVLPGLVGAAARLPMVTLPSTSGANTHLTSEDKTHEWRVISARGR
jgi:hypoxanthine-DNA glycosylase